ncbi:hypothetical protein VTO73DRAFT_8905 [Trametes versicolor]
MKDTPKALAPRYFEISILRPLLKSDWSRVDYYARRIKALGYYDNEYADQELVCWKQPSSLGLLFRERMLRPEVVSRLCLHRRGRWLLPNLTHLRMNLYDAAYADHIPMFLGPSLTSLAFALQPWEIKPPINHYLTQERIARVLDCAAELCPTVTELEMYPEYSSDIVVAARKFAYQCDRLEGYHVDTSRHVPFDKSFLLHLAAKPHLRKAWVHLDSEGANFLPLLSSPPIYHPFPELQVLYLKVLRLRDCTPLFPAMQHCRLFSLTLLVEIQPPARDVIDLFEALYEHCAKYTLHVLCLSQIELIPGDTWPPHKSDHLIDIAAMSRVLHFPNIRIFTLHLPLYGWLTDEAFRAIGDAWPGRVGFSFLETWGTPAVTPGTWEGVVGLVQRCPLLYEAHLLFDATRNLDAAYNFDARPGGTRIRIFDVVDSALPEDPGNFAKALFAIAPRAASISLIGSWQMEEEQLDGPLPFDAYTYLLQLDKIMCELRIERFGEEYTTDICGAKEVADVSESQPQEWNPWA